ncbi:MAG TPA: DUF6282 family protein [Gammaproteobacteria bacterium]|jgi:hypothetical protein
MKMRIRVASAVLAAAVSFQGAANAQPDEAPSLEGIIDLHAHVAPETGLLNFRRSVDAIEAAQLARISGMRGMVFKEHHTETASWAYLVSRVVPDIELFGGIVLNRAVGGINPVAVEAMALTRGRHGRVVYMPTIDSAYPNDSPDAVRISANGALLPEVYAVLEVMARHDLSLSTGHASPAESLMLIRAAREAGIDKIYVQHPNHGGIVISMAMMKEMAGMGALIEIVLSGQGLTGGGPAVIDPVNPVMDYGPQKLADIRELGPENVVITSDLGQPGRVNHAASFQMALAVLEAEGFSQAEIDQMTRVNPARFLGLD